MMGWVQVLNEITNRYEWWNPELFSRMIPPGAVDHGALGGLADDDHAQYHNDTRGDLRYAPLAKGVTNGDTHDHAGGDGGQIDHGGLGGLADDDHSQYHNNSRGDARYAPLAKGVTNGDSHDHYQGDGAQLIHGVMAGLEYDDHPQYIKHSLATAVSDFLVASGVGVFVKKTLAEVKTILGLGTAAYTASSDYAPASKGVTNGDSHDHVGGDGAAIVGIVTNGNSHDHVGGDGAQIDHGGLAGLGDDDHTQYVRHNLATATSDFLVGNTGGGSWIKKTLAEVKTILGLGNAAYQEYVSSTFTPAIEGTSTAGVGTYTTQIGRYTRIGDRVFFHIHLNWTAHTGTGDIKIVGLPISCSSQVHVPVSILPNNLSWTAGNSLFPLIINGTTTINVYQVGPGASVGLVPMDTSAEIYLQGAYQV